MRSRACYSHDFADFHKCSSRVNLKTTYTIGVGFRHKKVIMLILCPFGEYSVLSPAFRRGACKLRMSYILAIEEGDNTSTKMSKGIRYFPHELHHHNVGFDVENPRCCEQCVRCNGCLSLQLWYRCNSISWPAASCDQFHRGTPINQNIHGTEVGRTLPSSRPNSSREECARYRYLDQKRNS